MSQPLKYGSHVYVLLPCLQHTTGKILELGLGDTSSVLCNLFSMYSGRRYVGLETDRTWLDRMESTLPGNPHRELHHWEFEPKYYENEEWDVAFVDSTDDKMRKKIIAGSLGNIAKLVICHDSNKEDISSAVQQYKYRLNFTKVFPNTCIASNVDDLSWLARHLDSYEW